MISDAILDKLEISYADGLISVYVDVIIVTVYLIWDLKMLLSCLNYTMMCQLSEKTKDKYKIPENYVDNYNKSIEIFKNPGTIEFTYNPIVHPAFTEQSHHYVKRKH